MANKEAVSMVKNALAQGKSKEELKQTLLSIGFTETDANDIIKNATAESSAEAGVMREPAKPNSGGKIIIIMIIIGIIAAVGFAFIYFYSGVTLKSAKDCGTSAAANDTAMACFQGLMAKCEPAKLNFQQEQLGVTIKAYAEVKGGTPDSCSFYMKVNEVLPEDEKGMKGKELSCENIDVSKASFASGITAGLTSAELKAKCTGSLIGK